MNEANVLEGISFMHFKNVENVEFNIFVIDLSTNKSVKK